MSDTQDDLRCVRVTFGENRKKKVYFLPQKTQTDLQSMKDAFIASSEGDPDLTCMLAGSIDVVFSSLDPYFNDMCELGSFDKIDSKTTYAAVVVYDKNKNISSTGDKLDLSVKQSVVITPEADFDTGHLEKNSMHLCPPIVDEVMETISLLENDDTISIVQENVPIQPPDEPTDNSFIEQLEDDKTSSTYQSSTSVPPKQAGIPKDKSTLKYPCATPNFTPKLKEALRSKETALANCTIFVRECKNHLEHLTGSKHSTADHKTFVRSVLDKYPMFKDSTNVKNPYLFFSRLLSKCKGNSKHYIYHKKSEADKPPCKRNIYNTCSSTQSRQSGSPSSSGIKSPSNHGHVKKNSNSPLKKKQVSPVKKTSIFPLKKNVSPVKKRFQSPVKKFLGSSIMNTSFFSKESKDFPDKKITEDSSSETETISNSEVEKTKKKLMMQSNGEPDATVVLPVLPKRISIPTEKKIANSKTIVESADSFLERRDFIRKAKSLASITKRYPSLLQFKMVAAEYLLMNPSFEQDFLSQEYENLVSCIAPLCGLDLPDCEEEGLFFWQNVEKFVRPKTLAKKESILKIRRAILDPVSINSCPSTSPYLLAYTEMGAIVEAMIQTGAGVVRIPNPTCGTCITTLIYVYYTLNCAYPPAFKDLLVLLEMTLLKKATPAERPSTNCSKLVNQLVKA